MSEQRPDEDQPEDEIDRSPEAAKSANQALNRAAGKQVPPDETPDEAKRRQRPDAVPPRHGSAKQVQGYTDLAREREAELPPDKRRK